MCKKFTGMDTRSQQCKNRCPYWRVKSQASWASRPNHSLKLNLAQNPLCFRGHRPLGVAALLTIPNIQSRALSFAEESIFLFACANMGKLVHSKACLRRGLKLIQGKRGNFFIAKEVYISIFKPFFGLFLPPLTPKVLVRQRSALFQKV